MKPQTHIPPEPAPDTPISPVEERQDDGRTERPTDSMVTVPLSGSGTSFSEDDNRDRRASQYSVGWLDCDKRHSVVDDDDDGDEDDRTNSRRNSMVSSTRPSSRASRSSDGSREQDLDWVELEKTEELESKADPDDESTRLLLARLEQENNALATDPKSALNKTHRRQKSRPPSIQQLKRLVNDPRSSVRFSQLPTPHMTELEFWAALVADYPRTAQKLPTLTSNKIRAGVPPPLRGVVWPSIAGARDNALHEEFERLCGETSPYEGIIGKDIGRSWPNVDMFKDPNGEGQQMLARVLKCFSLYDTKIGYCQGLGFVVGPLLMHMSEADSFCVLVRLMDHYDLRSCFLPTLSGLHLRIYQFQTLLSRHLPTLHAHLEALKIEPVYVSQWFLSFFAVTCPLPMLLRIYDVLLLEGACETLMRVALSLMQRNEKKLLDCHEFEDVMQLLLSRSMWDTYNCNADDLVNDFVSLTSLVTRESLQALEKSYKESQGTNQGINFPQMQAAASRFLGRLWAGSSANSTKSMHLSSGPGTPSNGSAVRRTPSKQSMASTLNSFETTSDVSTAPTEVSSVESKRKARPMHYNKDKDLHTQIEDLLMALSDLQREQAALAKELQREREEREEDQNLAASMLEYIKQQPTDDTNQELITKATSRFSTRSSRRLSGMQTKQQLREDVAMWKEKYEIEATRCLNLSRTIDEHEAQHSRLREELREARQRIQESYNEKQRLERTIHELRSRTSVADRRGSSATESNRDSSSTTGGLRELKLGKVHTTPITSTPSTPTFNKRSSSLGAPTIISTEAYQQADEDSLLVELVNAKTAEAVARQELEEVKAKLETLRKIVARAGLSPSGTTANPGLEGGGGGGRGANITVTPPNQSAASNAGSPMPTPSPGGFFSWTRRNTSTSVVDAK
ncbi:hypothetical protein VTO42DRAFT_760 [Malbranchea cinnamomea]